MGRDSERLAEMAGFLGQRLNSALKDVIPPEAQLHLLNAQRELLTAVFLIYEHQVGGRRPEPASRKRSRTSRRPRVQHIEIE